MGKITKLRILMPTEYFYPYDHGGSEWSVYNSAKQLKKLGHEVEIFTPNYGNSSQELYEPIRIFRFPFIKVKNEKLPLTPFYYSNLYWYVVTFIYLLYRVAVFKPTHIHIQGKYFLPTGVVIGKLLKIPVFITLRDYIPLCPYAYCISSNNGYKRCTLINLFKNDIPNYIKVHGKDTLLSILTTYATGLKGWFDSQILSFFLRFTDARIAISNKLATIYTLNYHRIDAVVYNSAPITMPRSVALPSMYLYIGRLTQGKGIDILLAAYTKLQSTRKLPQLVVIGDGPLRKLLETQKNDSIIWLGKRKHSDLAQYIKRAKAVIVPSLWEEPFGRTALEAITQGIPVLASNKGALPEIISHKKYGYIVSATVKGIGFGINYMEKHHLALRKTIVKNRTEIRQKFFLEPQKNMVALYTKFI